jgi:hypothetical protein
MTLSEALDILHHLLGDSETCRRLGMVSPSGRPNTGTLARYRNGTQEPRHSFGQRIIALAEATKTERKA